MANPKECYMVSLPYYEKTIKNLPTINSNYDLIQEGNMFTDWSQCRLCSNLLEGFHYILTKQSMGEPVIRLDIIPLSILDNSINSHEKERLQNENS